MIKGNPGLKIVRVADRQALKSLTEISKLFDFVRNSVTEISEASPDLIKAQIAADGILVDSPLIMEATSGLTEKIAGLSSERPLTINTAYIPRRGQPFRVGVQRPGCIARTYR